MPDIDPQARGEGRRIAIAVSRFNTEVTAMLLDGCRRALMEAGVAVTDITVVHVPGAWELPLACERLVATGRHDGVVALGAVIRGETSHFDFICNECARGLQQLALNSDVPVGFGVLTCETGEQALERADPARKDKGREAATAVLEMIALGEEIGNDDGA